MPTIIRHKLRAVKIGKPAGHKPRTFPFHVTGDLHFHADAETIFGLLFTHVADGTMRQLVRLISERITWAEDLASELTERESLPLTWEQLLEIKRLLDRDPAATAEAIRRVTGADEELAKSQMSLF